MKRAFTASVAVAVLAVAIAAPVPALAQKLPWSDANPLERIFGKPAPKRSQQSKARRAQKPRPAASASTNGAVPVPHARPAMPSDAAPAAAVTSATAVTSAAAVVAASSAEDASSAESAPPGPAAVPTPEASPVPDPAPAATPAEPAEPAPQDSEALPTTAAEPDATPPAAAAAPTAPAVEKPDIDSEAAAAAIEGAGDEKGDSEPLPSAPGPGDAIPVPDLRPADAAEAPAAPGRPAKTAPVPSAEPAADTAPNSTEKLKARTTAISPATAVLAAAVVEDAEICEAELKKRGVAFTVDDSISEGDCGVLRPVSVTKLASGVTVSPKTQMLCRTALALDDWISKGVMPAVSADLPGRKLTEFRHASTYVCRPRASEKGISEHARGSAIDIAAFVFDKGEDIGVEAKPAGSPEARFQAAVRAAACGPFKTVLGPGTDSDHATHFHLDIAARNNGSTYCK